jgi:hypothetical protein
MRGDSRVDRCWLCTGLAQYRHDTGYLDVEIFMGIMADARERHAIQRP